jgi:hypothetical protein
VGPSNDADEACTAALGLDAAVWPGDDAPPQDDSTSDITSEITAPPMRDRLTARSRRRA